MQRLILLAVFVFAGWYGWKHYDALLHPAPRHEAVVRNDSGEKLVRIRLTVGGHTYVKEELDTRATVSRMRTSFSPESLRTTASWRGAGCNSAS